MLELAPRAIIYFFDLRSKGGLFKGKGLFRSSEFQPRNDPVVFVSNEQNL